MFAYFFLKKSDDIMTIRVKTVKSRIKRKETEMKRLLSLILAAVIAFSVCAVAYAEDGIKTFEDRGLVLVLDGDGVAIVGTTEDYDCSREIKKVHGKYDVVAIGPDAFANLGITCRTVIPETVRTIGENAYMGNNPEKVVIYPNVESIGTNAFKDCEIGETCFMGTEKQFEKVVIGEGNEALFANASYLSKQTVGEQMKKEALSSFGEAFFLAIEAIVLYPIYVPACFFLPIALPAAIIGPAIAVVNFFKVSTKSFETFFGSFNV